MLKSNYLKLFIFLSLAAVLILPTYIYFFLAPEFNELIVKNTEKEAERVANHLTSMFFCQERELSKNSAHAKLAEHDEKIKQDFHIEKIKLFLPNGETIYSSNHKDIGNINDRSYFTEIVAQGKIYSKVVEKDKKSLEGRTMKIDVVEIYVPIMKEDIFIGAFEIYYDITKTRNKLSGLISQVYSVLFIISSALLIAIFLSAYRAGKSIAEQKLLDEEKEKNYQTEVIFNKLLQLSLVKSSLNEVLKIFIHYITSFPWMEVEPKGAVFLVGDEPGTLELTAHRGLNNALISKCAKVPFGTCLCGRAAASGESIFIDCITEQHDIKYSGMEPHGHYSVPIHSSTSDVLGVFNLYIKAGVKRSQRAEEILDAASKLVAGIIERKQLEDKLHHISITDELTGLLNRRGFKTLAQQQLNLAERQGSEMVLFFIDLDGLKEINDEQGHNAGDQALIDTANIIKETFRTSDIIARIGGDEFVVLGMSTSETKGVAALTGRFQEIINRYNAKPDQPYKLSCSVGTAHYDPKDPKSLDDLLSEADTVMYEDKLKKKSAGKT